MLLELILVKAGYPSSLAKQQKPWRNGSGSTDLFRFYDHVSCISWGILVPLNNFKKIMGQTSWDVSFGFNCFSHLGQDSQHLLCKKKRSHFLAVKSTKKLMEFLWSCRLTNMLWVKIHIWTFSVKKSNKHCSKNICSKGGHEKFNFLHSRKQTNMTMKKKQFSIGNTSSKWLLFQPVMLVFRGNAPSSSSIFKIRPTNFQETNSSHLKHWEC